MTCESPAALEKAVKAAAASAAKGAHDMIRIA